MADNAVKPRLLVASGIFHPEPGGPATYLHEVLPALLPRWDIRVLTFGQATDAYAYPVMRVPRTALPLRYAHYARQAWAHLQAADLVYAHTMDLPLITRWQARIDVPRVMKVVGDFAWERAIRKGWIAPDTDIDTFQTAQHTGIVARQTQARSSQAQAMAHIIVPSDYLRRMVIGWGVSAVRVSVIYNALPPMRGQRTPQQEARQQLGLDTRPTLLTAARLTPWKGVDHLIAALHEVPNVRLLVAGEGDDLSRLRHLAQPLGERVIFLGRLERELLYQYMQASDYFALYSGYEGLAHTLLESLRVGTPLIASAKGGNLEVVRHGENGFLVPYVDIDTLIATLRTAFDGDARAALSANTQHGMERFTFDYMVERTDAVLRSVLSNGRL